MKRSTRAGATAIVAAAALALAAGASPAFAAGPSRTVFVQTDNTAGNQIVVYSRAATGTLTPDGIYDTGGLGGQLTGSVVDHLASQGSLAYDRDNGLLYAVNAGSNTISVFAVLGDHLALRQTIGSGGAFPASISFHRGLVYVLNSKDGGYLQGFAVHAGELVAIPDSGRALGLATSEEPQFVHTPGQVQFSPSGLQLIVTTKASGSAIDVFHVSPITGRLSDSPVVNPEPGAVPFAVAFDRQGHLDVAEAGVNALVSFTLNANNTVSQIDAAETGQAATCWVATADGNFFTSNAGSASLTTFQSSSAGLLTALGNASTDGGAVDATVAEGGRFLYVQAGAAGIVDEFAIGAHGALTAIGSVTVPGAVGGEGIAAG
jgi:6-phosphogluconolactonase (cycloisomerase 2 family)